MSDDTMSTDDWYKKYTKAFNEAHELRAALAKAEQERDAAIERAKMYNNDMERVRKQRDAALVRAEKVEADSLDKSIKLSEAVVATKRRGDFLTKIKEKLGGLRLSFDAPVTGRQIFAVQTAFDLACERAELDTGTVTMPCDPPVEPDREELGKLVRQVWIEWAQEQPNVKTSWLVPWDELSEPDREVDRRIGETLARYRPEPDSHDQRITELEEALIVAQTSLIYVQTLTGTAAVDARIHADQIDTLFSEGKKRDE